MPKRNAYFYYMLDFIKEYREETGISLSMVNILNILIENCKIHKNFTICQNHVVVLDSQSRFHISTLKKNF